MLQYMQICNTDMRICSTENLICITEKLSRITEMLSYTTFNKTENHFSPYPRSEGDINLYTRSQCNVLLITGKACNKRRKKACNPAGLRPVIKTVIFLQGCRGQGCRCKAAGQGCMARVQYAPLSWWKFSRPRKDHFNSEYFSQSTTSGAWKILFLDQIFFTASWDPKNIKLGTKNFFCSTKFQARAPSNFIVVKYSKCSRAGF
jgi:hypothetical protein